jgi:hypothetical protein
MSEDQSIGQEHTTRHRFIQHRFVVMIAATIAVSLVLVIISMALYFNSGAAQVDLSRPGYKAVREQVKNNGKDETFPAIGEIDKKSLDTFETMYDETAKQIQTDVFDPAVLSDESLSIAE